ncbi:O-phosphoseryl-tRNA(Sec) selenium transferase [Paramicrosporidium saccamoebae]|uniref:O-phosphoseryl-tRNA(Sec) selenium transferase n=1 Tax=Paramicrosporidium saccamoebae TaxID=1246581 RepID=A0A2H9THX9_9FUNG|nr:O-phosphoseryl-tRNA(Sec) selenium transferase [Paramicrosporidium saccamoebae]
MRAQTVIGSQLDQCGESVLQQAGQAVEKREKLFLDFLGNPTLPSKGYDDSTIEFIINKLACMDANNNPDSCGAGEREGRVYSGIVKRRHFGLAHGIGRSGELTEVQPKAPGSSLIQIITTKLVKQAIKVAGLQLGMLGGVLVLPVATGMGLACVLRVIALRRPKSRYVLMPRIDQKSCVKCVSFTGLELVVVENCLMRDQVSTDLNALETTIGRLGAENIAAVVATSSCFAPRGCDNICAIGELCQLYAIPQVVNNAYGLQSNVVTKQLNEAIRRGLVTAVIQSSDKNFMVPVGGSIVFGADVLCAEVAALYPGRASISPLLDLLITLLSMGAVGYRQLLQQRIDCFKALKEGLCLSHRVLETPSNDISIALVVDPTDDMLGARLFHRSVSGARLVRMGQPFGTHHTAYPHAYLTVAASIGITMTEVRKLLALLEKKKQK